MIDWVECSRELILLAVDAVVVTCAVRWFRNTNKAVGALHSPVIDDHKALQKWFEKEENIGQWAVLQGPVESIGPSIHSFNDKSVRGVVQRLKVKEFVTARGAAGFWQDGERTIANTLNVVPFGVRVGRSVVEMEEPTEAAALSLRTVASEFTHKSTSFLDQIWSFLIGTRHRGIQSTEEMLLMGTKVFSVGPLVKDKTLNSVDGASMRPYVLSELTMLELRKMMKISRRWAFIVLLISGCIGAALISFTVKKTLAERRRKAAAEARRRERLKAKRSEMTDTDKSESLCVICDNPRDVILLPCGHICVCSDCSSIINKTCPICRAAVDDVVEYFIS